MRNKLRHKIYTVPVYHIPILIHGSIIDFLDVPGVYLVFLNGCVANDLESVSQLGSRRCLEARLDEKLREFLVQEAL